MIRIAYFISAYKAPESVIRIVNVLNRESDYFYIHFDKAKSQDFESWKRQIEKECHTKNLKIVSEFDCKWSFFGIVDATLSAMSFFETLNYDYFINLTGECYPLKSTDEISETLAEKKFGFLTFWKLPYEGWYKGGMNRINNRFYALPKRGYPYVRLIQIPRFRKKLPCNLEPYGGWSLCCLPKDLVSYIVEFTKKNPQIRTFFKRAHAPSELFVQTILMNSPFKDRIINDNKRYIDFIEAHPRTLTIRDFELFKKGEWLFGRKFNPNIDKKILDQIDKEIMGVKG